LASRRHLADNDESAGTYHSRCVVFVHHNSRVTPACCSSRHHDHRTHSLYMSQSPSSSRPSPPSHLLPFPTLSFLAFYLFQSISSAYIIAVPFLLILSSFLFLSLLPTSPLPFYAARGSRECISSQAGSDRIQPSNIFWCYPS